jgi:hypothetical protein
MDTTPETVGFGVGVGDSGTRDGVLLGVVAGTVGRVGVGVGEAPLVGATSLHPTSPVATTNNPATSLTLRR